MAGSSRVQLFFFFFYFILLFFFFQAEDGIRDIGVTGVQTCALPIFQLNKLGNWTCKIRVFDYTSSPVNGIQAQLRQQTFLKKGSFSSKFNLVTFQGVKSPEIGRASCRERV